MPTPTREPPRRHSTCRMSASWEVPLSAASAAVLLCSREPALHLAECAHCRAELEKFSASVGLFSTTSLAWSETRPAAAPQAASRWQSMRWAYAPVGWALAVAVVIAVGVPAWRADHITPAPQVFALADYAGTEPANVVQRLAPGGHLGLFMGHHALREDWLPMFRQIALQSQ